MRTDDHRYEVVAPIGGGGMGRVYRGVHWPSGQSVAIKTLRSELRKSAQRRRLLLNEATAAAQLRHPNIVELLDVGRDAEGVPFLVMELVEGPDLEAWSSRWPGWMALARVLDDTLAGLVAAHAAGVIHRDLKPGNVLCGPGGAKIADFGIAQVRDPTKGEEGAEGPVGTPVYMAPEQFVSGANAGPWTDLYALGVMLYELLAGQSPFKERQLVRVMMEKHAGPPPKVTPRPGLDAPRELLDLVDALLSPEARRRPRFAQAVREQLARLAQRVEDRVPVPGSGAGAEAEPPDGVTRSSLSLAAALDGTMSSGPHEVANLDRTIADGGETSTPTFISGAARAQRTSRPMSSIPPELPIDLPAAPDPRPGASLLRLRELPLVGRAAERAALAGLIEDTCTRGGARLLVLLGEAGVGKSRIARWGLSEVERTARMEGAAAGYDVTGAGVTGGLRHALRRLLGSPEGGTSDDTATETARAASAPAFPGEWRWLERPGEPPPFDASRLARWLRAAPADEALPPDQVAALAHAAVRAASRVRPVYLWLDDLGWARDGTLELVERLLAEQDARVLLVATLRTGTSQYPPLRERLERLWHMDGAVVRTVPALEEDERRELVRAIVPMATDLAGAIAAAVRGTPLLVVQMIYEWVESGLLEAGDDGWRPPTGKSIADLLAARPLEALLGQRIQAFLAAFATDAAAAEAVLLRASLLGQRFEDGALRASMGGDVVLGNLVDDVLDRALLHGLLRAERGRAYRFDHGLVQEALRDRLRALSAPERRRILRDTATGLVAHYGSERAEIAARVATLNRDAGDDAAAWNGMSSAVLKAAKSGDANGAEEHLAAMRAWLDEDRVPELDLRRALTWKATAQSAYYGIRYEQSLAALAQAVRLYELLGDGRGVMACRGLEGDLYFFQDRFAEAARIAAEVAALATEDDAERAMIGARACARLGDLAVLADDLDAARHHYRRCHALALASGQTWYVIVETLGMAQLQIARGDFVAAEALLLEARRAAEGARDDHAVEDATKVEAFLRLWEGDPVRARRTLDAVLRPLEARDDRWLRTELRLLDALLASEIDSPEEAVRAVRAFRAAFDEMAHDEVLSRWGMRRLAARLVERGLATEAEEVSRRVEARGFGRRRG